MNTQSPINLLKKMLPGLLPILVFIVVDEIWGTRAGLIVAVVFGVAELVYTWIKDKVFDKFILFDTGLLVAMGGISLWLDNDIFFKLKPGFINIIFCVVLGLSAFSERNLLLLYSQRYFKGIEMDRNQEKAMQGMFRILFWILAAHTLLIFYSAYFMSKEAWGFISGVLLYILFLVFFGWQYLGNKITMKKKLANEEWVPVVDEEGNITGKATRTAVHSRSGLLHPVVHLQLFNSNGQLYLQKRSMSKDIEPGKWDTAVGGHIGYGENIEDALKREVREELGITDFSPQAWTKYKWVSPLESELVFSFVARYDGTFALNAVELEDGRFWSIDQIEKAMGNGEFTPNFENEYRLMKEKGLVVIRK